MKKKKTPRPREGVLLNPITNPQHGMFVNDIL